GSTFVCPSGRRSGCASERTDGLLGAVEAPHLPAGPIPMGGRPLHERAATTRARTVVFDPPVPGAWIWRHPPLPSERLTILQLEPYSQAGVNRRARAWRGNGRMGA